MEEPRFLGAYELVEKIGSGGMGTVYRAKDRRIGNTIALKVIHESLTTDPRNIERFRREAYVASLLTSPYTVRILEFNSDQGVYFMASEFVDGESLSDVLEAGPLDPERALTIAGQVAFALNEAEARGVVHRDIKPSNILIARDGAVKVADFGIARVASAPDLTVTGGYVGTLAYSAPEQLRGESDIRGDFYAVGVTLYQCLTGDLPFRGTTPYQVAVAIDHEPPPLERIQGFPPAVVQVIERCLKKDPAERYQRAAELSAAIEQARRSLTAVADEAPETQVGGPSPLASGATVQSPSPVTPAPAASPPPPPGSDTAGGAGRGMPPRGLVFGGAAAIVGIIALAFAVFSGGDDGPRTVQAEATATPGVEATATVASASPTPQPTQVPPSPTPSRTSQRSGGGGQGGGGTQTAASDVVAGDWFLNLVVIHNDCGFFAAVGEPIDVAFTVQEAVFSDGLISDTENVQVYDTETGLFLGDSVLIWPNVLLEYELSDGDRAFLYMEFFDGSSGWAYLEERFFQEDGSPCLIVMEEQRPQGFTPELQHLLWPDFEGP